MRVISWNLLRLIGAGVEDVAALVQQQKPDILFMQEAMAEVEVLPAMVGGRLHRARLPGRIYGLAVWSPDPFPPPRTVALPVSAMPGRLPRRLAQIVHMGGVTFANVHLSHGQVLNRLQLMRVARVLRGPAAVIGDYNAVGPTIVPGFRDIGPREATHSAGEVLIFRLDRCLAREVICKDARALDRGASDHRPILLEIEAVSGLAARMSGGLTQRVA